MNVRRDVVPSISWALLACWLVPVTITAMYGLRRSDGSCAPAGGTRPVHILAVAALLFVPGFYALINNITTMGR